MRLSRLTILGLVVTVVACQDPAASIAPTVTAEATEANGVVAMAKGSGHVERATGLRKFTISGTKRADGSVSGQYDLVIAPLSNPSETGITPAVLKFHGAVTCMSVDGNSAYLGGTVERDKNADLVFGDTELVGVAIELIDNGDAGAAVPDQISSLVFYTPATPGSPQTYCDDPTPGAVFPIQHGNITVR